MRDGRGDFHFRPGSRDVSKVFLISFSVFVLVDLATPGGAGVGVGVGVGVGSGAVRGAWAWVES